MNVSNGALIASGIRALTAEEVEHYQHCGWVKLPKLVAPELVSLLLTSIKAQMGEDAQGHLASVGSDSARPPQSRLLFNAYDDPSQDDAFVSCFALSKGLGRALSRCADGPVRFWGDGAYVKMPVTAQGGKTPWHQDWPYYPFDRSGSLTVWIALVDVPPERGPMRFCTGSHLFGAQGRVIQRTDGRDMLDILPTFLRDRIEISPVHDLVAGDATIHNDLTIHSASENCTDEPRWVYTLSAFPAETLYTGAPQRRTDGLGLRLNETLDHPKFPILCE